MGSLTIAHKKLIFINLKYIFCNYLNKNKNKIESLFGY